MAQLTEMATELAELHLLLNPNKRRAFQTVTPGDACRGAAKRTPALRRR